MPLMRVRNSWPFEGGIEAAHAAGFLAAMLQCVEAQSGDVHRIGIGRTDDAEDAALLAQRFVPVRIDGRGE